MKIRNKLIGITAILIVILFIGMSAQPAVTPNTTQQTVSASTISVKEQKAYDNLFISNPVNTSDQFSNAFMSWMINKEHANPYNGGNISRFHMNSNLDMKVLLPQFLSSNPSAVIVLQKITAQEQKKFNQENIAMHSKFLNMIKSGKLNSTSKYTVREYGSNYTFLRSRTLNGLPNGAPTANGEWIMVTVNYYGTTIWIPLPWPLDGYSQSFNYGENDVINFLYVGPSAQNYYNQQSNAFGDFSWNSVIVGGLFFAINMISKNPGYLGSGFAAFITGLGPELGGIAAGLAAGFIALGAIELYFTQQFQKIYDSTYANPINGNQKEMWMYYSIVYIYCGIGSSFTWNGYTNTGSVAVLPYVPLFSNNPPFIVVSGALSGLTHSIAGKIGWNNWGSYS